MTMTQLEQRLTTVEAAVEQIKDRLKASDDATRPWWRENAGRFADDPIFDKIARLGAQYRQSLGPGPGKVKRDHP